MGGSSSRDDAARPAANTTCWRCRVSWRASLVALGLGHVFGIKLGHTLGIFAGSMTSTATLQAALDVMNNKDPSIGYSIAYPFGVIGPILCIYFMTRWCKPKFPPKTPALSHGRDFAGREFRRAQR